MKQYEAIGIKFRRTGKIYDFLSNGVELVKGDFVIIEVDKGEDIAEVILPLRTIEVDDSQEMKPIISKATDEDIAKVKANAADEPKAFKECKRLIDIEKLDMKLLFCEYTLDRSKLTFYFTAEGRIDFRQLVKELAKLFRTRIEMRQIGVRDATKMLGGFGLCGREFCCTSFLRKFDNISIKMAKNQNLILNPNKISGVCGRLMCCLMFEKEQYDSCDNCGCGKHSAEDEFIEIKDDLDNLIKGNG